MSALTEGPRPVTVREDLPELDDGVACSIWRGSCPNPATHLVIVDCSECGRLSRPACDIHAHFVESHRANGGDFTHKPCHNAPAVVDRVVRL